MRNHEINKQNTISQITFWIFGLMLFAVLAYAPKTYANQANIQNNNKRSFENRPLDRNDPELIAFYEQIFGKSEKKSGTPAQKSLTKQKTPVPSSRVLKPSLTNPDKKTENQRSNKLLKFHQHQNQLSKRIY